MLVLSRKEKEEIHIGNNVTITILRVKGHSVRVGISAPKDVRVIRGELQIPADGPVDARSALAKKLSTDESTDPVGCQSRGECPLTTPGSRRRKVAAGSPMLRRLARQHIRSFDTNAERP